MYAMVNCDIYSGTDVLYDHAVVVDQDRIAAVVPTDTVGPGVELVDIEGLSVAPGFVDIQVNGGGGVLFNDSPTSEALSTIVEAHRRFGTTDMLPTYITGTTEGVASAVRAVQSWLDSERIGVLGIHLEGPQINMAKAGVHDKSLVRELSADDVRLFTSLRNGVTVVTIAPEVTAASTIRDLVERRALVAAGHTNATYEQMVSSFDAGVSCVTHLYNAMSQLGSREPGAVGAALDSRFAGVRCGIIVDGHHVAFGSVRVAWQAAQWERPGCMFLVTDAMPPVGSDLRSYRLGSYEIEVRNGVCVTADGTLAGSALDMATAVRNCVQHVGVGKSEALRMASTYPASFLGLGRRLGYIATGYRANMTILDNELYVHGAVVGGALERFDA